MTTRITSTGVVFNDSTQQTTQGVEFSSGTLMLFQQSSAPVGWTKQTTHNNKTLRVVSGTASSGGSVSFTSCFTSGLNVGSTTLSSSQIPSHNHLNGVGRPDVPEVFLNGYTNVYYGNIPYLIMGGPNNVYYQGYTTSTGGGGSHNHTMPSFDVQYVDLIIASKN